MEESVEEAIVPLAELRKKQDVEVSGDTSDAPGDHADEDVAPNTDIAAALFTSA